MYRALSEKYDRFIAESIESYFRHGLNNYLFVFYNYVDFIEGNDDIKRKLFDSIKKFEMFAAKGKKSLEKSDDIFSTEQIKILLSENAKYPVLFNGILDEKYFICGDRDIFVPLFLRLWYIFERYTIEKNMITFSLSRD